MLKFIMELLRGFICPTVKPKEPKPNIQVLEISRAQLATSLDKDTDIKSVLYGYLDSKYYYCSLEDWGKVLEYIYMVEDKPDYVTDRLDCEDFAFWLKAMISYYFGLNTMGVVIGDIPQGRHGFNMFYAEDGWWLWEPQVGDQAPFRPGHKGYKPLHILI